MGYMSPMEYAVQGPAPTLPSLRPYRWGRFQGRFLIIIGSMLIGGALAYSAPTGTRVHKFGIGFFSADPEISRRFESGEWGYALGMLSGYLLLTIGTGIGLLKKRTFGLVLFLLLALRAMATLSPILLAFTLGSVPYYYKRWREFRIP